MPQRKRKQVWKSAAARRFFALAGNPATIEEAVRIVAERLLGGAVEAPTPLDTVAEAVGLTVTSTEEDTSVDDTIHDDGLRFYETTTSSPIEQRMELARQIARAFFASLKPRGFTRGVELDKICELLATELVLPTAAFHSARRGKLSVEQIVAIAEQFEVSLRTAARRFIDLPFVAILEVSPDSVNWAYGGVRTGYIDQQEPDFRAILEYLVQSDYEKPILFFSPKWPWFGSRCVEWKRLNFNKTLVLIRLPRQTERSS